MIEMFNSQNPFIFAIVHHLEPDTQIRERRGNASIALVILYPLPHSQGIAGALAFGSANPHLKPHPAGTARW